MYVIKMEDDKTLVTTIPATIYQGERGADTITFLLPVAYNEQNVAELTMLLRYILPDNTGHSEVLDLYPLPYSAKYYQYKLGVESKFTAKSGEIELWLTAMSAKDDIVFKTSSTMVTVEKSKNIEDYLSNEDKDQLIQLASRVDELQRSKADNLSYDGDTRKLSLTAGGVSIGDTVIVPTDTFVDESKEAAEDTWSDMTDPDDGQGGNDDWESM